MGFFDKGSLWKHRNLGYVVNITAVDAELGYALGWANPLEQAPESRLLLSGYWTAASLVKEFVPLVAATKWDRLLDGESALEEDTEKSSSGV